MPSSSPLRHEVISLYKELLHLGRAYPLGYTYFRTRLHSAFKAKSTLDNPDEIRKGLERGEWVKKGTILKGIERCAKDMMDETHQRMKGRCLFDFSISRNRQCMDDGIGLDRWMDQ
ncbi:hypothetical protein ACMFMF_008091 [Clarireedia jacksonii]